MCCAHQGLSPYEAVAWAFFTPPRRTPFAAHVNISVPAVVRAEDRFTVDFAEISAFSTVFFLALLAHCLQLAAENSGRHGPPKACPHSTVYI